LIAAYLTTLLKKQLFLWTLKATAAFLALKQAVTTPLVLHLQDFSKPFVIDAGDSTHFLSQQGIEGLSSSSLHLQEGAASSCHG